MSSKNGSTSGVWQGELAAYCGHVISPKSFSELEDYRQGVVYVDESGMIVAVGDRERLAAKYKPAKTFDFGTKLILPGLVDLHIHLVQFPFTGMAGETLLGWLNKYIFPGETKFADSDYAQKVCSWFFREQLTNGTTLSAVWMSVHTEGTDIAFKTAASMGNRVIMGKMLMDRNTLPELTEDTAQSLEQSEKLCKKWHGFDSGRLQYAFTPRFAPTCTEAQLEGVGKVWRQNPGTYVQTHLSENSDEVEFVKYLFPKSSGYLDVYKSAGMVGRNALFAHCIHMSNDEMATMAQTGCAAVHCPSSNFFLKSGAFPYTRMKESGVKMAMGSDIAAGPTMSIFNAMRDAAYTHADWIVPRELFYLATLGGAVAANLDSKVGSLSAGKEADFIVVDPGVRSGVANDILKRDTDEILSSLVYVGDDRMVLATYVRGKELYRSPFLEEPSVASVVIR